MSHQDLIQVEKEVREGRVTARPHGNLCIYKYSQDCAHGNLWNQINRKCRGIIFDTATGAIVSRPFDKFYNLGERPDTMPEQVLRKAKHMPFRVTEKLDGSLCQIYFYNNAWHCATPGSLTSEQAIYAEKFLLPKYDLSKLPTDITLVCEMIAPMDRRDKVVEYGDRDELVLITAFENKWEQIELPFGRVQYFAQMTHLSLVPIWQADYDNFLSLRIPENTEGYVISFEDSFRVKIKSIEYIRAFRLVSEFSHKHLLDYIETGEYREAIKHLPESKKQHFDDIYAQIMTMKGTIELEAKEWFDKCDPNDMKKSAFILEDAGAIKSIVFLMLRGREIEKLLWKIVRERFESLLPDRPTFRGRPIMTATEADTADFPYPLNPWRKTYETLQDLVNKNF